MTPKQKRIITILAVADIAVILALAVLVTRPSSTGTSSLPTPMLWAEASTRSSQPEGFAEPSQTARSGGSTKVPPPHDEASTPGVPLQETCQWKAAQLLAQAGLGGTVVLLPDGSLRFEIVYPLSPGEIPDEAAQLVWVAFDVVLALQEQEGECASLTWVEVTILAVRLNAHDEAQSSQADTQINASVSAVDLTAFGAGELSEDEFIERVTYTTDVTRYK